MRLRRHQDEVDRLCGAIAAGSRHLTDILAAVTPGGGKSALPVIAAARLLGAIPPGQGRPIVERICWVVPRDTLRRQAEEAFVDPAWRAFLRHGHAVRAAENAPDLCRGLAGYVTTYQSIAAAPDLHLAEFQRHRYLLCVDELHHLPGLSDLDEAADAAEDTSWSRALLPLLETARLRLLMSGTLERSDRRPILWLNYRRDHLARNQRRVELAAQGWAVIGYDRRAALAERSIIPIRFGALDGEAEWMVSGERFAATSFSEASDKLRPMLFTALRTGYAEALLRRAFTDCRKHRAQRRDALGAAPGQGVRGLGKLLVVAPDQATARRYTEILRGWMGPDPEVAAAGVALAISDESHAIERIARFRLRPEPSVLVTVGMAYEGMDAPEISHVACLTQIRSVPWLEQMVARATRFDPHGGAYDEQRALIYHPDDPMFRMFRRAVEVEQSGRARARRRGEQEELPLGDRHAFDFLPSRPALEPLRSEATELHFETIQPRRPAEPMPATVIDPEDDGLPETPTQAERRLRRQVGQLVATQVIEDGDGGRIEPPVGYHAYNAVLKQLFGKARATMTQAELEAEFAWLERNRISDHLKLIRGDHRYSWSAQRRRSAPRRGQGQRDDGLDRQRRKPAAPGRQIS
ncbi:MAG TPA: DEAD/DEAH box helicase family protein [Geminicoccus sp.]|uniref:DEAD/DEAH box helicase n=1 Tax=Geminicoccus sp. TaxID=2024832 RepID=UPI002E32A5D7|nr:DEAD/DEAH box helicase family protein [Geminicoccus sp.]HEX2527371.1 DEAD/DEAH box helicase family protein [Geminicoccus sp.]